MEILTPASSRASRFGLGIGIVLGLVIGIRPAQAELPCQAPPEAVRIELAAQTLDGTKTDLEALRGHPVLIDVWATWCAACRTTLVAANNLAQTNVAPALTVIGLSVDRDPEDARAWLAEALPQAALLGWQANPSETFAALNIRALPATVLLDDQGRVLAKHEGTDTAELEALLTHARHCGQHPG
jgi:cytochrome c biogenesis protein CcmG/thiol:disulfide interchange protein DsbE